MIRFIKKWWLLHNLRKEILRHSMLQVLEAVSNGRRVLSSEKFFIEGSEKYPGLAKKSLRRFSRILWWRKKDDLEKLKRRIHEYYDIFEVCVKEGSIEMSKTTQGLMPSVATPQADKMNGWLGLFQELLSRYRLAWSMLIIPLLIGIFGSTYFKQLGQSLWKLIF